MEPIAFNAQLTSDDYVSAVQWHARRTSFVYRRGPLYLLGFAAAGVLLAVFTPAKASGAFFAMFALIMSATLWSTLHFFLPRRARRIFGQQRALQDAHRYEFNEAGMRSESVLGEMKMPWNYFRKSDESPEAFLLYMSDASLIIIPERFVPSLPEFREMLKQCIGRPSATITGSI